MFSHIIAPSSMCSLLCWSVWRFRNDGGRASVPLGIALLFGGGFGWWGFGPLGALIGALLMVGSLSTYLLPVGYALDGKALKVTHLGVVGERDLSRFRRIDFHPKGAFLSPTSRPSPWGRLKGMWIHLPVNGDREAISMALKDAIS